MALKEEIHSLAQNTATEYFDKVLDDALLRATSASVKEKVTIKKSSKSAF